MLLSHRFQGKDLSLCLGQPDNLHNKFTAIVGRNGSGKSRLLAELVTKALTSHSDIEPSKSTIPDIIALSTSPFDKFLLPDSKEFLRGYHYLGLRGLYSSNLSLSFITRIIGGLLRSLQDDKLRLETLSNTLDYLEYHDTLDVRFSASARVADFKKPDELIANAMDGRNWNSVGRSRSRPNFHIPVDLDNLEGHKKLKDAIIYFSHEISKKNFSFNISSNGIVAPNGQFIDMEKISILLEYELIKLKELSLHKKGVAKPYRVNDASSGEQCVLMAVLGIASRISDGAFIFIDEPEICLHPEWQERYIKNLMEAFSGFKGCQFVIATHSPQIISQLNDENCYVLDLQTGITYASTEFNRRSADFQLAQLFKAPGFSNEYLIREIVGILSLMSAGKPLTDQKNKILSGIISLKTSFRSDDPVLALLALVEAGLSEGDHE